MPSLTIDPAAIGRRIKPEKHRSQLFPRALPELVAVADVAGAGRARLMFDTNVYIHDAAGKLSADAQAVIDQCLSYHCTVCVAELMTGIGNSRAAPAIWKEQRDYYLALVKTFPDQRLLTPDEDIWAEAGLIAGTLARTQGFQPHQRKECLNDALIYLTAAKEGLAVVTSNRGEFDLIQQLAGRGMFVHYPAP